MLLATAPRPHIMIKRFAHVMGIILTFSFGALVLIYLISQVAEHARIENIKIQQDLIKQCKDMGGHPVLEWQPNSGWNIAKCQLP